MKSIVIRSGVSGVLSIAPITVQPMIQGLDYWLPSAFIVPGLLFGGIVLAPAIEGHALGRRVAVVHGSTVIYATVAFIVVNAHQDVRGNTLRIEIVSTAGAAGAFAVALLWQIINRRPWPISGVGFVVSAGLVGGAAFALPPVPPVGSVWPVGFVAWQIAVGIALLAIPRPRRDT